jgi:hypothetical protein
VHRFKCFNGPMPTTAAQAAAATGTAVKTMLQVATPSTRQLQIISWGFGFRSDAGGSSVVELLQTDVAATVTAHVASGVIPLDPNAPASLMTLGTSATGYGASAEGSITATRVFDVQELYANAVGALSSVNYSYQFMPDERPIVAVSKFLRIRATYNTSANMVCWICWDE